MAIVTGPTNAAIAAHLFGLLLSLLAPLVGPDLIMVLALVAALLGPDLISVNNGSITWSQINC